MTGAGDDPASATTAADAGPAGPDATGEDGSAILLGGLSAVVVALLLVVALDLGAYLVAVSRAQAAADAAALAAVSVSHPLGRTPGSPEHEARRVAAAAEARLETCSCAVGSGLVRVRVSVAVPAMVVTQWFARRVTAAAMAHLVPP